MNSTGRRFSLLLLGLILVIQAGQAQILTGIITDKGTKEGLIGATVLLIGTYKGAATDMSGKYTISGIKPGDYSVRVS
jgi:hypothetical protein